MISAICVSCVPLLMSNREVENYLQERYWMPFEVIDTQRSESVVLEVLKNKFRIEEKELRNISHFPVKAVFNMVSDARFIEVIEGISEGIGFGENYGACVFWNDLDDYDKENIPNYEGAEFGLHDGDEIIIGYEDLFYYLTVICQKYCEEFPDKREKINTILHCYKLRFGIQ